MTAHSSDEHEDAGAQVPVDATTPTPALTGNQLGKQRKASALVLAQELSAETNTRVRVYHDRGLRKYRVVWTNGPEPAVLQGHAEQAIRDHRVPGLTLDILLWDRQSSP